MLLGSILGLVLRMFLKNNLKIKIGFSLNNISLVNLLSSLFLGILVALNPINGNYSLFLYSGFLGCLSTFSSFIYQLFVLLQRRQFGKMILHYLEVITLSILLFYVGYYLIQIVYK